jgi:hypothetical protein
MVTVPKEPGMGVEIDPAKIASGVCEAAKVERASVGPEIHALGLKRAPRDRA